MSQNPWEFINPFDPLIPEFALQHDLRERFLQALEDIVAVTVSGREYKAAFEKVKAIASDAIDSDSIDAWNQASRPLRIDAQLKEAGAEVDAIVAEFIRHEIGEDA